MSVQPWRSVRGYIAVLLISISLVATSLGAISAPAASAAPTGSDTPQGFTFGYDDFSSLEGLKLNGLADAIQQPVDVDGHPSLRLLRSSLWERSSVFWSQALQIATDTGASSFSQTFQFRITGNVNTGADGIVFVICDSPDVVGGDGLGIGYSGLRHSIGVEFDTWYNGGLDPNGNHIGIDIDGNLQSVTTANPPSSLENGSVWTGWVDYDGATHRLEVRASDTGVRPEEAIAATTVNIPAVVGADVGYFGVTSASGTASQTIDVLSWKGTGIFPGVTPDPEPQPDPPVAIVGEDQSVAEGDVVGLDGSASTSGDEDQTLSYSWRVTPKSGPPVMLVGAQTASPSFVGLDDGEYRATLTVTNGAGLRDSASTIVTVKNRAPKAKASVSAGTVGGVTQVNGTFTDVGLLDSHKVSVDFGDGSSPRTVSPQVTGSGWGSFFASHVYSQPGSFTVTTTVTDSDGGVGTAKAKTVDVRRATGVWANSTTGGFRWSGGTGSISGDVHSNGSVFVHGSAKTVTGAVEYASSAKVSGQAARTIHPVKAAVAGLPYSWDIEDFAPDGAVAAAVGNAYHDMSASCSHGVWHMPHARLDDGVYYVPCDVHLSGSSFGGRVTLAAIGAIEVTGSAPLFQPFWDGLSLLSDASGAKAIHIAGVSSVFGGALFAEHGEIRVAGSTNSFSCALIADTIEISGTKTTVDAADCRTSVSNDAEPQLVPELSTAVSVDRDTALPNSALDYTVRVGNDASTLVLPATIAVRNLDDGSITVTGHDYAVQRFDVATGRWVELASEGDDAIDVRLLATPAAGVDYAPKGSIDGTTVEPGAWATWGSQAVLHLNPETTTMVLDPDRTSGLRVLTDLTVSPTSAKAVRVVGPSQNFIVAVRDKGADARDVTATVLLPNGATTVDSASEPDLAALAPGARVDIHRSFEVPAVAGRTDAETDAGYLLRLQAADGTKLIGAAFSLATGGVGRLAAPISSATATEGAPVLEVKTTGEKTAQPGTDAAYTVGFTNSGTVPANALTTAASADGATLVLTGAPTALAAHETASADTTWTVPDDADPGTVAVRGEATSWTDGNGNSYGPLGSTLTATVAERAAVQTVLSARLADDVGQDNLVNPGDAVGYTLAITNTGTKALSGVRAVLPLDADTAIDAGSVTVPDGAAFTIAQNTLTVALPDIAVGGSVSFQALATVVDPFPASRTSISAQATITADGLASQLSSNPINPTKAQPTTTPVAQPNPAIATTLEAAMRIDADGSGTLTAGDTIQYTIQAISAGNATVTESVVRLPAPTGTALVAGSASVEVLPDPTSAGMPGPTAVVDEDGLVVTLGSFVPGAFALATVQARLASPTPTDQDAITAIATATGGNITATDSEPLALSLGHVVGDSGAPTVTGLAPADGTRVTAPTPIGAEFTAPNGTTITDWKVTARPDTEGIDGESSVVVIGSGTGAPPATWATFDPTILPNGPYTLTYSVTASDDSSQSTTSTIVVDGQLKLGRASFQVTDFTTPVAGTQLSVGRQYDSFDGATTHDFGVAWSALLIGPRLTTNRVLGAGGWYKYSTNCVFGWCSSAWASNTPHVVTVTWPDGHVESFDMAGTGGTNLTWTGSAVFTARAGTTSTLAVDPAQATIADSSDGNLYDGIGGKLYAPTRFILTTADGVSYVLDTDKGLVSWTTRDKTVFTVGSNGVTSSAGGTPLTFKRDSVGRITRADGLSGLWATYAYDSAGDLVKVTTAQGATTYSYDAAHRLLTITEPSGTSTLDYDADGRLVSITGPDGTVNTMTADVDGKTRTWTDAAGAVTVERMDDLGDVLERTVTAKDASGASVARTTTMGYDADGHLTSRVGPTGASESFTWDSRGHLTAYTDAAGAVWQVGYDESGQLTSATLPNGAKATLNYDASGHITSYSDPDGTTQINSDDSGRPSTITMPSGQTVSLTYDADTGQVASAASAGMTASLSYDASGRVSTLTGMAGDTYSRSYDAAGNLTALTGPLGLSNSATYDEAGRVVSVTRALNGSESATTTASYDDGGRMVRSQGPEGTTVWTYDSAGRVATEKVNGETTSYTWDGFGQLTSVTEPGGCVTRYGYDAAGNQVRVTNPAGATTRSSYDDAGRVTAVTDAYGKTTSYHRNSAGQVDTVTDPLGRITRYSYDWNGRQTSATTPAGEVTTTSYDSAGRVVKVTNPAGATSTWTYAPETGELVSSTDAAGVETTYGYDDAGRQTAVTVAGATTTTAYDALSRVVKLTSPSGATTTYSYDAGGRQTKVTTPAGTTRTVYDSADRVVSEIDALGAATDYTYNARGQLASMTDALGHEVSFGYDEAGNQTSITDPNGHTTSYGYDVLGLQTSLTDPLGNTQRWAYDDSGRLDSVTNARGQKTTYTYDDAGQLVGEDRPEGQVTRTWDADGRALSVSDWTGTTSYEYSNALGLLSKVTRPTGSVTYGYDSAGRRTSMQASGQSAIQYSYDPTSGDLAEVTAGSTSYQYGYDDAGRLAQVSRGNQVTTAYSYDDSDRLTGVSHALSGALIDSYTYGLDAVGNRTQVTSSSGTEKYAFDAVGRLTKVTAADGSVTDYSYDAAGNRLTQSSDGQTLRYSYDDANRLVSTSDGTSYGYDPDGNQILAGDRTSAYDSAGYPTRVGSTSVATDADGLRSRVGDTSYVYDATGGVPQVLAAGGTGVVPAVGGGFETGAGYLLTDALGTPTYTVNGTGQASKVAGGGVFGAVGGSGLVTGFAGGVNTAGGLVQFGVRDYDPAQGRFVSADSWTVGGPGTGGYNRYAYAGNNPVTFTDPSGHVAAVEYAVQILRGPLAAAGEVSKTAVLFSAVFGAAAGVVGYAVFGPEPKTVEGALTWALIGGIDGICGAVTKNAFLCGSLNGALFRGAEDRLVNHRWSSWQDLAMAAFQNGLLSVGAGWAGYGLSKVTKPAWTWLKNAFGRDLANAAKGATGADDVLNGVRLSEQLARESAEAVFTPVGTLKPEVIAGSRRIIAGSELGNPNVVRGLTSDGSNIADWGKYTTETFPSPQGPFQVHFYYNRVTQRANYAYDYKVVFTGGR
ncbi:MAG TPA: PKD domain-containing protein [Propionicimonas sp.]|nr:PKD domain-containing protein [Propionicimonas sp.]